MKLMSDSGFFFETRRACDLVILYLRYGHDGELIATWLVPPPWSNDSDGISVFVQYTRQGESVYAPKCCYDEAKFLESLQVKDWRPMKKGRRKKAGKGA